MHSEEVGSSRKWLVAFACCFINFVLDGIGRLVGIFFVATLEEFPEVGRQAAALPYSLCTSIRNLSGPLVGFLAKQHGIRKVTVCGTLLSSFAIGLCYVAPNILWVTILFGAIHGIGYGLGNILLPVAISDSFQKHQATAIGISLAGSCLGSFLLPSLFYILLDSYGLRGLFLITSSIVLHCIPAGLLLRPPIVSQHSEHSGLGKTSKSHKNDGDFTSWNTAADAADSVCSSGMYEDDSCSSVISPQRTDAPPKPLESSGIISDVKSDQNKAHNGNPTKKPLVLKVSVIECTFTYDSRFPSVPSELEDITTRRNNFRSRTVPSGCYDNFTFSADDHESCAPIDLKNSANRKRSDFSEPRTTDIINLENGICSNKASTKHIQKTETESFKQNMLECVHIFTDQCFLIITFALAAYEFVFVSVITVMVDFSKDLQLSQDKTKWIFIIFSAGDLFGRLCLGWITDKKIITRNCFAALCFLGMAGSLLGMSIADGFVSLLACFGIFGVFESGSFIMFPLLIIQCIKPEAHAVAIGSSNLLPGLAALAVAPSIGYFRDEMGSYMGLFYILAAVSVISSILCLSLPHVANFRSKR